MCVFFSRWRSASGRLPDQGALPKVCVSVCAIVCDLETSEMSQYADRAIAAVICTYGILIEGFYIVARIVWVFLKHGRCKRQAVCLKKNPSENRIHEFTIKNILLVTKTNLSFLDSIAFFGFQIPELTLRKSYENKFGFDRCDI